MSKTRNSYIELLRIISIFIILTSHYCIHGVELSNILTIEFGLNRFLLDFLSFGNLGTIIFVLITGYYLINSNGVKIKKILHLIIQVWFYSLAIYLILLLLHYYSFSIKDFIKVLFPISFKEYWFVTSYFILYIFHPYLNKMLNSLSRKEHGLLIIMMFLIFSVLRTLTTCDYYGNQLVQFILYYIIGGYLNKYPKNIMSNNRILLFAFSLVSIIVSILLFEYLGLYISIFNKHSTYFLSRTSPFMIILGSSIFCIAIKKKPKEQKIINNISPLVFGVYLISANNYLKTIIWNNIFHNLFYINKSYLFLHIIVSVSLVFIICLIIEFLRYKFFSFIFNRLDKYIDRFQNYYFKKIDSVFKKRII